MKYRVNSNVAEINLSLEKANKKLEDAMLKISSAKEKIEDLEWDSESKNATISLIDLCIEYQKKLNSVTESNLIKMNQLEDSADDFMRNSTIVNLWR